MKTRIIPNIILLFLRFRNLLIRLPRVRLDSLKHGFARQTAGIALFFLLPLLFCFFPIQNLIELLIQNEFLQGGEERVGDPVDLQGLWLRRERGGRESQHQRQGHFHL